MTPGVELTRSVTRGLSWSLANSIVLRFASVALGVVLARIVAPEHFGVFAVALTVQSVLATLADLGLGAELVRTAEPERKAPTVASLSLGFSILLGCLMAASAAPMASILGAPDAASVIAVLSLTIPISGAGAVPYALLIRSFSQSKIFVSSVADFAVGAVVTILLVDAGMGAMALAVGRVAAQSVAIILVFVLARVRPRFGYDGGVARQAVAYGLPLALANLVSWAVIGLDNLMIARIVGLELLGFYVLAFNVSNWPMSAIAQAVRGVSFAAFSRLGSGASDSAAAALPAAVAVTWAAALIAGAMLAVLANPLILLLYGERWARSGAVLFALGFFGSLRVLFDLMATYLMACGRSRGVLAIQVIWFVSLVPSIIYGASVNQIVGTGWAHVLVGLLIVLPAYLVAIRRTGASTCSVFGALWPPVLALMPAAFSAKLISDQIDQNLIAILAGGTAGALLYLGCIARWANRHRHELLLVTRDGIPSIVGDDSARDGQNLLTRTQ